MDIKLSISIPHPNTESKRKRKEFPVVWDMNLPPVAEITVYASGDTPNQAIKDFSAKARSIKAVLDGVEQELSQ